jgi:hypothetical protein
LGNSQLLGELGLGNLLRTGHTAEI